MTDEQTGAERAHVDALYRVGFRLLALFADGDPTFADAAVVEGRVLGGAEWATLALAMAGKEMARTLHTALTDSDMPPDTTLGDIVRVQEARTSARRAAGQEVHDLNERLDEIEREMREGGAGAGG